MQVNEEQKLKVNTLQIDADRFSLNHFNIEQSSNLSLSKIRCVLSDLFLQKPSSINLISLISYSARIGQYNDIMHNPS